MTLHERLAEIEARANAATPGPWVGDDGHVHSKPASDAAHAYVMRLMRDKAFAAAETEEQTNRPETEVAWCSQEHENFEADEAFIAAARTDVPWLTSQLRRAVELLHTEAAHARQAGDWAAAADSKDIAKRLHDRADAIEAFLAGEGER